MPVGSCVGTSSRPRISSTHRSSLTSVLAQATPRASRSEIVTPAALAAADVARERLGISCEEPLKLPGVANAVFWLRPHPVVAKVGTRGDDLVLEHRVTSALRALGAAVAEPIGEPVRRNDIGGIVTLWVRLETLDHDPPDAEL